LTTALTNRIEHKNMQELVPKLRFSGFEGEWVQNKLSDLYQLISGQHLNPDEYQTITSNSNPYFTGPSDFTNDKSQICKWAEKEGKVAIEQDILFTVKGNGVGSLMFLKLPKVTIGRQLMAVRANSASSLLLFHYLQTKKDYYFSLASGNMIPGLSRNDIMSTDLTFPPLPEQTKIAEFLTAIDKRIELLTAKKEKLTLYKKGVMQKIFNQEIRFKKDDGGEFPEWEEKTLDEIAERVTRKNRENNLNVLTISAQQGLVSQLEYFNKSVSAKDVTNYYLLEKDEFAYNISYSEGYPMGAIKRLKKYDKGVVSTLYICFRFNKSVSKTFMEQYFEAGLQNLAIEKVAQEGVRNHGLLNIGVKDFLGIALRLPSKHEQIRISNFFVAIDAHIQIVEQQITLNQTYKKGLLQQMFV
jgi:type I restriction enzyme, S subunit